MAQITTPQYPIFSWLVAPNDAGDPSGCYITGELTGAVVVPLKRVFISRPLSGGAYGFGTGTDTVAKMLDNALDLLFSTAPGDTSNPLVPDGGLGGYSMTSSVGYVFQSPGSYPVIRGTVSGIPGGTTLEITFVNLPDCFIFGAIAEDELYTMTALIPGTTNRFTLPTSPAGVWTPNNLTVWEDRTQQQTTVVSQSAYNPGIQRVITWAREREIVQFSVPTVNVERIWAYRRADSRFQVDFPTVPEATATNLYEQLMRAAREGKLIRVFWNDSTTEDFRILDPTTISDPASSLTDVSGRGRIYSVSFAMEAE